MKLKIQDKEEERRAMSKALKARMAMGKSADATPPSGGVTIMLMMPEGSGASGGMGGMGGLGGSPMLGQDMRESMRARRQKSQSRAEQLLGSPREDYSDEDDEDEEEQRKKRGKR